MYANINMQGRLVNDPEIKEGKNGRKFVTFRMVVNQGYGEKETASFYNCTGSEELGNRMLKANVAKGSVIHLSGSQTIRTFTDKEGAEKLSVDIRVLDWDYTYTKGKNSDEKAGDNPGEAKGESTSGRMDEDQYVGDDDDLPV